MSEHIKDFNDAADAALPQESGRPEENKVSRAIRACMVGGAVMAVLNGCGADMDGEEDFGEDIGETSQELSKYSNLTAAKGEMRRARFYKTLGRRYTVCINPKEGDPDLYGHYTGYPTTSTNQFKSKNGGLTSDCFSFNASSSGYYYLGMYGNSVGPSGYAKADLWLTETPQAEVPSGFSKALTWPLPGYKSAVNRYSEFNSPWGNEMPGSTPFFAGSINKIHTGMDIYALRGTNVVAACDGYIRRKGFLDDYALDKPAKSWGFFVGQECTKGGTTISIAYDHLNDAGRPSEGTYVTAGTLIGTTFDINETNFPGEEDHLHLGICKGAYKTPKNNAPCTPHVGAVSRDEITYPSIAMRFMNPWITTNPGIYK